MVLYRWSKSFHMGFHVQIPPWPPWDDYHPSSFILVGSSPELEFANFWRTAASGAFEEPGGREQRGRMYGETSPQVGSWLGKSWFEWLKATWGGRCGHAPTETSCRKMIADVYSSRVWNHLVLKMLKDFKGNNRWRTYHRPNFGISYVSFLAFSWVLFPLAPALTLIVRMRHPPLTTRFGAVARKSGSGWEIVGDRPGRCNGCVGWVGSVWPKGSWKLFRVLVDGFSRWSISHQGWQTICWSSWSLNDGDICWAILGVCWTRWLGKSWFEWLVGSA